MESDTLKLRCLDEIAEYEASHQPAPATPVDIPTPGGQPDGNTDTPPVTVVKTKKRKNLSISNVAGVRTYTLETEADIERFTNELKDKLKSQLEEDTIIVLS